MRINKVEVSSSTFAFVVAVNVMRLILSPLVLAVFVCYMAVKHVVPGKISSIVTTGGTGGHVFPAIRFVVKAANKNRKIYFVTNDISRNMLGKLGVCEGNSFIYTESHEHATIPVKFLPIVPVSVKNISSLFRFGVAMLMAFVFAVHRFLVTENVIGFGGYASFPLVFFAAVFCKKIYIHEQNMVFGAVNELFIPFAKKVFTAFPVEKTTPNCHYAGMPLPHRIEVQPTVYHTPHRFGKHNILIISGSSGGVEAIQSIVPAMVLLSKKHRHTMHVYHQVHFSLIDTVKAKYAEHNISATVLPFFENIYELLPSINLCISRSGASSIVDLLSCGVVTIFVPLKTSARNHQVKNTSWVVQNNVGFLYKPWESNVYNFAALISFCLNDNTNEISIRAQNSVRRNARSVMCNAIWG